MSSFNLYIAWVANALKSVGTARGLRNAGEE
jgi:hypothetical protein